VKIEIKRKIDKKEKSKEGKIIVKKKGV